MTTANPPASLLDNPFLRTVEPSAGKTLFLVDDLLSLAGLVGVNDDIFAEFYPDFTSHHVLRLPGLPQPEDESDDQPYDEHGLKAGWHKFVRQIAALTILYCGRSPMSLVFRAEVDARWDMSKLPAPANQCTILGVRPFLVDRPTSQPPAWAWADVLSLQPDFEFPDPANCDEVPRAWSISSWPSGVTTGGIHYSQGAVDLARRIANERDFANRYLSVLLPLVAAGMFGPIPGEEPAPEMTISTDPKVAGAQLVNRFSREHLNVLVKSLLENQYATQY